MLSFLTGLPANVLTFIGDHLGFFLGYAVCVLFPMPWLNSWVIGVWQKLLTSKVVTEVPTPAPTPVPAPVTPTVPPAA